MALNVSVRRQGENGTIAEGKKLRLLRRRIGDGFSLWLCDTPEDSVSFAEVAVALAVAVVVAVVVVAAASVEVVDRAPVLLADLIRRVSIAGESLAIFRRSESSGEMDCCSPFSSNFFWPTRVTGAGGQRLNRTTPTRASGPKSSTALASRASMADAFSQ